MTPDGELLREYARTGSEEAFAELVRRHVNLVYSAGLRQVAGDPHFAQDIAQTVFTDLARKAQSLSSRESLTGWLYTSTHFAAAKIIRTEHRRRQREETFMREPAHDNTPSADWEKLRPALDAVMHELNDTDREAVLLRYFENRAFSEVGAKLGLNENAARMRVERALEKLRSLFGKRGITAAATLASIISANAVQTAPASLAATLARASLAATGTQTITLLKIMTATKWKLVVGAVAIAVTTTALVLQHEAQATLKQENELLQRKVAQLKADNESLSNSLTRSQSTQSLPEEQINELLRLRAQVGDLRRQLAGAVKVGAPKPADQLNPSPATDEPEEVEKRMRMRSLSAAKVLATASVTEYAEHHQGEFPTNWIQLKGYFDNGERNSLNPGDVMPDTEADFNWVTNEFEFLYQGSTKNLYAATNFNDAIVVREKQPWKSLDGKWIKSYGFADGHAQLMSEPPEGFEAWERQHMALPPANQ